MGGEKTAEPGKIILMILVVGVAAFGIGFGVTAVSFLRARAPAEVVTVPDVREMAIDEARRVLGRSDLDLLVGDSFPNPTMPTGAILAQAPLPGEEVGLGAEIRVIISTGPRRPRIPAVDDMTLPLATRALQTAGFNVLVEEIEGEGRPGRAIETDPPGGAAVALPATVRLLVGGAPSAIAMPAFIGMMEADAMTQADDLGLHVQEVVYEQSRFGEAGSVVAQEPAPGDSIRPGDSVRLRVTGSAAISEDDELLGSEIDPGVNGPAVDDRPENRERSPLPRRRGR